MLQKEKVCGKCNVAEKQPFTIKPFLKQKQSKKMKNMKKVLAAIVALVGFATTSNAQATATATASATIVTPIAISRTAHMNFGNIAVTSVAGSVLLGSDGTRTPSGGVTLPAVAGTVSAASFTVTGTASYTYVITLPTTPVSLANGANSMNATAFNSSLGVSGSAGNLGTGGSQVVTVGATLAVAAAQAAGSYVSSGFTVEVNYN